MEQISLFKSERRLSPSTRSILMGNTITGYITVVSADTVWTLYKGQYAESTGWVRLMSINHRLTNRIAAVVKLWLVRNYV